MNPEIKNAVIEAANIRIERGFILDASLTLNYGDCCQGFGGFALYLGKNSNHHKVESVAGHFIYRVMQIAGVESWDALKGRTIRVKADFNRVHEIGHIIKDDWFNPASDFEASKKGSAS